MVAVKKQHMRAVLGFVAMKQRPCDPAAIHEAFPTLSKKRMAKVMKVLIKRGFLTHDSRNDTYKLNRDIVSSSSSSDAEEEVPVTFDEIQSDDSCDEPVTFGADDPRAWYGTSMWAQVSKPMQQLIEKEMVTKARERKARRVARDKRAQQRRNGTLPKRKPPQPKLRNERMWGGGNGGIKK